jgi:hypothetical protein
MLNPLSKHLMYVVYDGIGNSVFQSLVLTPLLEMLNQDHGLEITLVSFELNKISPEKLMRLIPAHDRLHFVLLKKFPFIGKNSLWLAVCQLYWLFGKLPCDRVITRGPLAGWIAMHALKKRIQKKCIKKLQLTIQARGLCAEEYRYTYTRDKTTFWRGLYHCVMYRALRCIEYEAYCYKSENDFFPPLDIEAVSPALKEYLAKNYRAPLGVISIAQRDLPFPASFDQVLQWRVQVRTHLSIAPDAYVYCYSGSYKPWQCAEETVQFFVQQYKRDQKSFLLIFSQDKDAFVRELVRYNVPKHCYRVASIQPRYLLEYLSAADAGLLFREADIINWVSRPTKMLEYQAVGLKIIHNNTVAWLANNEKPSEIFKRSETSTSL